MEVRRQTEWQRGTYTIGGYPDISLKLARDMHREAREHVAQGIKPMVIKDQLRVQNSLQEARFSYYLYVAGQAKPRGINPR